MWSEGVVGVWLGGEVLVDMILFFPSLFDFVDKFVLAMSRERNRVFLIKKPYNCMSKN